MITFKRISKIRTPCYFYYSTKQEPNPKKPENEQLLKTPDAPNTSESNAPKQKPKPKFQLNILKWYLDNAQTPGQLLVYEYNVSF